MYAQFARKTRSEPSRLGIAVLRVVAARPKDRRRLVTETIFFSLTRTVKGKAWGKF